MVDASLASSTLEAKVREVIVNHYVMMGEAIDVIS